MPSNALDAYGLMLAAIKDPNPVMVLLPKALLRVEGHAADPRRAGRRGRTVADDRRADRRPHRTGSRSGRTLERARRPDRHGANSSARARTARSSATAGRCRCACRPRTNWPATAATRFDVIDLRSIFPYDWDLISQSVQKTGRVLIVNEDTEVTNFGEHLLAAGRGRALLRPDGAAANADGQARAGDRHEPELRDEQRAAARQHPRGAAGTGDGSGIEHTAHHRGHREHREGQRRRE